jgi:hypothetical protein
VGNFKLALLGNIQLALTEWNTCSQEVWNAFETSRQDNFLAQRESNSM